MDRIFSYIFSSNFLEGVLVTLELTFLSQAIAIVIGFVVALLKMSKFKVVNKIMDIYIWIFRGIPVMVQLVFVFNVLPKYGFLLTGFQSAIIALSLNESAYMAEIIRTGLTAVGKEQIRAAKVLGMTNTQIMFHIILPQALIVMMPPTGNQIVAMVKTSSMASVIGVGDLLRKAQTIAARNFDYFSALMAAVIYYLVFTAIITFAVNRLEVYIDPIKRKQAKQIKALNRGSKKIKNKKAIAK